MPKTSRIIYILMAALLAASCSYNPFIGNNHTTGDPAGAVIGAGAGAGAMALVGAPKPYIWLGGITGGMFGYYVTTLRADAADILAAGGKVYKVGDYVGIYIPTDRLFAPNTADLLPTSTCMLDSVVTVLNRYPKNSIIVSGDTSGFYCDKWEQKLSEKRAKVISAFLWKSGINNFKPSSNDMRKLNYVGYGDYLPIASHLSNKGIRANSRIQIASYPSNCDLKVDRRHTALQNMGSINDTYICNSPAECCPDSDKYGRCVGLG